VAFSQLAEGDGTDRHSKQVSYGVAEEICRSANLAIPSFVHGHFQQGGVARVLERAHVHRRTGNPIQGHALSPGLKGRCTRVASNPNPVGLAMAIAWVGEAKGQVAVVAEQEGTPAVRIQSTHRMEAGLMAPMVGEQIEHGGAALGVVAGAEHPRWFVEEQGQGSRGGGEGLAGNGNLVALRVCLFAQLGYAAVHPYLAFPEKGFGLAAGANS
jgi:hypothetical protein